MKITLRHQGLQGKSSEITILPQTKPKLMIKSKTITALIFTQTSVKQNMVLFSGVLFAFFFLIILSKFQFSLHKHPFLATHRSSSNKFIHCGFKNTKINLSLRYT